MVKNLKLIYVQTINGEKHYIVQSLEDNENPSDSGYFDEAKVRKIMKKEAYKPLLLSREE